MPGLRGVRRIFVLFLFCVILSVPNAGSRSLADSVSPPGGASRPLPRSAYIFGGDDRRPVPDTTVFPYSAIGMVEAVYGSTILQGTGTLIGNRTVLTSAHVVYDADLGGWPDAINFAPGRSGSVKPFGTAAVVAHVAPDAWLTLGDDSSDMAVLALDTPLGEQAGFMQIAEPDASVLSGASLLSAGYPADLDHDLQYTATGPGVGTDGTYLLEQIDTEPGQSGSPIWFLDGPEQQPRLVAVLKGTRQTNMALNTSVQGIGVLVTPQLASMINNTLSGGGDTPQNIPAAAGTMVPNVGVAPGCGSCGAGAGQAVLLCTLGWGACFLSRRWL